MELCDKNRRGGGRKIFVLFIFLLLLLPAINTLTLRRDAEPLQGVENEYSFPDLSRTDYWNGVFQASFENSFSHGFSGARAVTRLYNELRLRVFRESSKNTVICKDGSVIFKNYVNEYLGLDKTHICTPEYIEGLSTQLRELYDLAERNGKVFAVVLTPSKADFWLGRIPEKYLRMERLYTEDERGARLLAEALREKGVPFVDGPEVLLRGDYSFDLFTETGIHYTREAAIQVLNGLCDVLREEGVTLKRVVADGRIWQEEPRLDSLNQDDDIWLLMNVFSRRKTLYSYPVEREIIPEDYDLPKVFWQGGSFIFPLFELIADHEIAQDENCLFYAERMFDRFRANEAVESLEDERIRAAIIDSNLILLEVNEECVYNMGSGFLPVLKMILSENIEMEKETASDLHVYYDNFGPEETYNGVTWRWSRGKSGTVRFANAAPDNTLQVTYWVPYSLYASVVPDIDREIIMEIYVNDILRQQQLCSKDSIFTVYLPPEWLSTDGENTVEIRSPYSIADGNGAEYSFQLLTAGRAG